MLNNLVYISDVDFNGFNYIQRENETEGEYFLMVDYSQTIFTIDIKFNAMKGAITYIRINDFVTEKENFAQQVAELNRFLSHARENKKSR